MLAWEIDLKAPAAAAATHTNSLLRPACFTRSSDSMGASSTIPENREGCKQGKANKGGGWISSSRRQTLGFAENRLS